MENGFFKDLELYSEVLQDSVLDLVDIGKVRAASGSALTLSKSARKRFFNELYRYKDKIVLRPVEISNSPEVIRRLGVIAINTAIEVDIYGQVNSTHVQGSGYVNKHILLVLAYLRNSSAVQTTTPSISFFSSISIMSTVILQATSSTPSIWAIS
jgi:acetyl-CoA hydrolase/succinyl-CoA:acetate CoA-transferase